MTHLSDPPGGGRLVLVLGDQLSFQVSSLAAADPAKDTVLMAEVAEEARYVGHHKKKIAFVFSAMRHFAEDLREAGWTVRYVRLDDGGNSGSLAREVSRALGETTCEEVVITEPGEYRLKSALVDAAIHWRAPLRMLEDTRFVASHSEFEAWASGRKQLRMEFFYREMRRKTGLLMAGDAPEGGRWNFDAENRKPASGGLLMPGLHRTKPDRITEEVLSLVETRFDGNFGTLRPFWFAVTRAGALASLEHFIEHALPQFGDFQDAMLDGERFLYHSVLSLYLNAGLLDPLEVCRAVEAAYHAGHAPLNAV
ncbi:MAG: cryptochrome/photolyase family protein, partial [Pseudomonadota bacterium]